jgi:hypothetical protein
MIQAAERAAATAKVARTGRIAIGEIGGKVFGVGGPRRHYEIRLVA